MTDAHGNEFPIRIYTPISPTTKARNQELARQSHFSTADDDTIEATTTNNAENHNEESVYSFACYYNKKEPERAQNDQANPSTSHYSIADDITMEIPPTSRATKAPNDNDLSHTFPYSIVNDIEISTPGESGIDLNDTDTYRMSLYSIADDVNVGVTNETRNGDSNSHYSVGDVSEAPNPYEDITTDIPAPTKTKLKSKLKQFTELWTPQRIYILGACVLVFHFVLTICALAIASQSANGVAQMRSELDQLKMEFNEKNIADNVFGNNITSQGNKRSNLVSSQQGIHLVGIRPSRNISRRALGNNLRRFHRPKYRKPHV